MAGPITRGSAPKLLWPGLNKVFWDEYNAHPDEWDKLFDKSTSEKAYEEDFMGSSFGLVPVKPEGSQIMYDDAKQFYISRYTNITYGLGFIITEEAQEDNLYMQIGTTLSKKLALSVKQTREIHGHDIYNDGFSGGPTYGDGKTFFATDHPLDNASGTYSNMLSPGADLSEASLEDLLNQIDAAVDNRGKKIKLIGESLHVPYQLRFEAKRILGNPDRPATADRDINAMYHMGMLPKGFFIHHFFDDADAFFIRTNVKDGVRYFERRAMRFEDDNDFDTANAKFKVSYREVFGVTDPRAAYASQGA